MRRKRKRLTLKLWQPNNIRKCRITGILPLLICGHGMSANNYAIRSDDTESMKFSFGGGVSTVTFNLKVLYEQHLRGLNRWSASNDILDLARYLGCDFYFYRHKKTDYIVQYSNVPPFTIDKDSTPSYHPGILMKSKHKVLVPSFDTKPRGRSVIKIHIEPPKMFLDKWYAQSDLCDVNLASIVVTLASFTHPFCRPQTDNPCVTFQVLQNFYNAYIGTSINITDSQYENLFENYLYKNGSFYQQVLVSSFIRKINHNPDGSTPVKAYNNTASVSQMQNYNQWVSTIGQTNNFVPGNSSVHYNFATYKPNYEHLTTLRKYYFSWETAQSVATSSFHTEHIPQAGTKPTKDYWEYRVGMFSPIFLSPYRTSPIEGWPMAYRDISYNPLNDKAIGNRLWLQSIVKPDTQFHTPSCTYVLEDKPLWCMTFGYRDFIKSVKEHEDIDFNYIVCVICPYTKPPLFDKNNPNTGYVFYDSNFGNGKWIDGSGFVPVEMQCRWRITLAFQTKVMTDIAMSGPFSYPDELKNTTVTAKYKFRFKWGGNMLYQQTIKNPCTDGHHADSYRQPRDVQVSDPLTVGPRYVFHQWDWRRGWLNDKALKRMLQKPLDAEYYQITPKRPRIFPPTEAEEAQKLEESSTSEEESIPTSQEENQTQVLQYQLRKQLRGQRELRQQLKQLFHQLIKTQAGLHLNPLLFTQQ